MEWRQLSLRMLPPNPQLLPYPVDSCSPQHTLNTHTQAEAAKGLIYLSAVEGGWPLLSWWWLWQHRTLYGRLLTLQYTKAGCPTIIFSLFHFTLCGEKMVFHFSVSVDHNLDSGCWGIIHPDYESPGRRSSQNWAQNLVTVETPLITRFFCCTTALLMAGLFN